MKKNLHTNSFDHSFLRQLKNRINVNEKNAFSGADFIDSERSMFTESFED